MTPDLDAERRNERVTGILVAATVLLVGYASGFGHLLGRAAPSPATGAALPATITTVRSSTSHGAPAGQRSAATRRARKAPSTDDAAWASDPGMPGSLSPNGCEPGLASAVLAPLWMHLRRAHLERTPSEQVGDVLDPEEYLTTHTALIEGALDPAYTVAMHSAGAAGPFWMHVKRSHLDEGPSDQVADVLDTDRYARSHTALLEVLLAPTVDAVTGSCS